MILMSRIRSAVGECRRGGACGRWLSVRLTMVAQEIAGIIITLLLLIACGVLLLIVALLV